MADQHDPTILNQEEIDALLGASRGQPVAPSSTPESPENAVTPMEKDALGEIANIAMGSAATTLSTLLNHRVNITSPRVDVTSQRELMKEFNVPYLLIEVRFTEGLQGSNLLVIKTRDAAIIADLMMGNDGSSPAEELSELEISATAEAMNQMMGSAATAMSTIFGCTVSISPPKVRVLKSDDDLSSEVGEPVVVIRFRMTVGEILDTEIMEVLSIATAREEAAFLLGGMENLFAGESAAVETPPAPAGETPAPAAAAGPPAGEGKGVSAVTGAASVGLSAAAAGLSPAEQEKLQMLLDIPLKVTVVLGRTRRPIKEVLGLTPGAVVELSAMVDEPVEILVNGIPVAHGEVVVVNENFGVRITSIISPQERVQHLGR
ncbi:MAG: flagellar motor switch phosphatase FliY [Thermoanaerobacterales bacterium]|nr:flagellar motor switch phosphatase FliY [Bacillota bacterium]MDI6906112.1 flagellar motor switch phosphatase FliY [Thermoanaerobacterales bacterium]